MPNQSPKGGKDWWKTHFTPAFFESHGLRAKTAREVRGASRLLGLRGPAEILDLGCGAGRHALGLAALGHRVTGLDFSEGLVAAAASAARAAGVDARFVRGDMRRLGFSGRFDAVINLFTSFGYFDTAAEDASVLRGVRRALKPGGTFLIDVLNKAWFMRHFTPTFWQKTPEGEVLKAFNRLSFNDKTSRLSNRRTVHLKDGTQRDTFLRFKVYDLEDMRGLLAAAGLKTRRAWGGFDGRAYGKDTFRLIVLAVR